jgi:two-component system response regulator GlrR
MARVALIGISSSAATFDDLARTLDGEFAYSVHLPAASEDVSVPPEVELALVVLPRDPQSTAMECLPLVHRVSAKLPTVVVGDHKDIDAMQSMLAAGVADIVVNPFSTLEILTRVRRALGLLRPDDAGQLQAKTDLAARGIIGNSPGFNKQIGRLGQISACDATVLILGETGTGKEVFARAIHYGSRRAGKPLVAVNCGAIPTELIEDELFGHVKGAYTTAHTRRAGLVREAEGGSLLLDDIDCLPLAAQAKLLRFLQEREYRPVGSDTVQRADVRVIAASNRDLASWSRSGRFRQDLFYRVNVLSLTLPPLRERREDLSGLAQHFIRQHARQHARPVIGIAAAALHKLQRHDWPGNVRELQHVLERAVLLAKAPTLVADDIDLDVDACEERPESFQTMKARMIQRFERSYIEDLLSAAHGNISEAARAARKNRRAFFELVRKHHISPDAFRPGAQVISEQWARTSAGSARTELS